MWYYKSYKQNGKYSIEERENQCNFTNFEEITEEEYNQELGAFYIRHNIINQQIEQEEHSKDERIAALEEENAALLYKLLTGEDLEDEE